MKYSELNLGQIEAIVNKLGGMDGVKSLLADELVVSKRGVSVSTESNVVDLNADPFLPDGWKVEEHKKGGQFVFSLAKMEFYRSRYQERGKTIEGNKLRKELATQSVFNANLLDYLLKNKHLIPDEWKGKAIFFWGTIYRDPHGDLYIRYLCWRDGRWGWSCIWLGSGWGSGYPALRLAS